VAPLLAAPITAPYRGDALRCALERSNGRPRDLPSRGLVHRVPRLGITRVSHALKYALSTHLDKLAQNVLIPRVSVTDGTLSEGRNKLAPVVNNPRICS
jgi:hypothetical protein